MFRLIDFHCDKKLDVRCGLKVCVWWSVRSILGKAPMLKVLMFRSAQFGFDVLLTKFSFLLSTMIRGGIVERERGPPNPENDIPPY